MGLEIVLRELSSAVLSSDFDPAPITFRPADECGVRPVRTICNKALNEVHRLKQSLNRNAFLCGCLDLTQEETLEHLIIGFGRKYGRTTKVFALAHTIGVTNRVSPSRAIYQAMQNHLMGAHTSELLFFHNHPLNQLNVLFDNTPLASSTDRATLLRSYLQPLTAIKSMLGGGQTRFYLGENGFVREFRTPDLLTLLEAL